MSVGAALDGRRMARGVVVVVTVAAIIWMMVDSNRDTRRGTIAAAAPASRAALSTDAPAPSASTPVAPAQAAPALAAPSTTSSSTTAPSTSRVPFAGWSDPALVGEPWSAKVQGLLTFRGNPTRSWYGTGPIPRNAPSQVWRFPPSGGMCAPSVDQTGEKIWCGTGWTGQPAVFERDGKTWVVFGAFDKAVHFLDAATGERLLPDFPTGDIIKGSVTIDPDGFPLVYTGSRDNYFRILAIDRDKPVELFKLSAYAVKPVLWNDDWDGSALIIDDYLIEGGENSQLHIVKLNRGYGPDGKVTVNPELVFNAPGWDDELLKAVRDQDVSIENSVAIYRDTLYFANGGGLVQGWDLSGLKNGKAPTRVFRYWAGDDIDASIVIDNEGMLYIGVEYERQNERSREVGQIIKLDPRRSDPLVWKLDERPYVNAGVWGTMALYRDVVVVGTDEGKILGIDRMTGARRWSFTLPRPTWQSPVVIDDVLLMGDCNGVLHAYDMRDTTKQPSELWSVPLGGCIESTPAVWKGRIYLGTRNGGMHALAAR